MKKLLLVVAMTVLLSVMVYSMAGAQLYSHGPAWLFHEYVSAGGSVTIWGTVDCVVTGTLFHQDPFPYCHWVGGFIPPWCNDILILNWWKYSGCSNKDWFKVAAPSWNGGTWVLNPLRDWLLVQLPSPGDSIPSCPGLGDPTGAADSIYIAVRLDIWAAGPQPLQDQYTITNGTCPQLPGYLIGTTPIQFTPLNPSDPFSTTPFTGTLYRDCDVVFKNLPGTPAVSGWGLGVLVLALSGVAVVFLLRRRARAVA
jgi:hypothetical protein